MPGCGSRRRIQVHHIKTWSNAAHLRYEVSNGICLCYNCHKQVTTNEQHYEKLFFEIINNAQ